MLKVGDKVRLTGTNRTGEVVRVDERMKVCEVRWDGGTVTSVLGIPQVARI